MNNPLLEKAKYYLNESNRLTEELDNQIQYSAVLEAVLEELVGTENFLKIMELYVPAIGSSSTHKVPLFPINSSYEPDLVQGIMNLLVSSRNENDLSEGQARMNRLSNAANKQHRLTGTVQPGLRSALDQSAGNQITRALGKTQYHTGQEMLGGSMVSSAQMGGAITPHQQALQNGDRLTGIKPDYANFGVGMAARSVVSANNRTGNFHPENDSAGGHFGHVAKVTRDGATVADRYQQLHRATVADRMQRQARLAARRKAAKEAGMMDMPEHSNLVQTIMKFLVK